MSRPLDVAVLPTMDCEPPDPAVSAHASRKSGSGPADYEESRRSIEGYVEALDEFGYTPTLFVHPQVAERQRGLFSDLRDRGACLGLHLHPYKLDESYDHDLGAYPASRQRSMLREAASRFEDALGEHPAFFRPGVFSANDATFGVLEELGFRGGSVSSPGRVHPDAAAVWAGAPADPHRAHEAFRMLPGDGSFVNVPMTVDRSRPIDRGHAGQSGYESLYLSASESDEPAAASGYDFERVVANVVDRIAAERPRRPALVTNTHNNMDFADPEHPATRNLRTTLRAVRERCGETALSPVAATLDGVVDRFPPA